MWRRIKHGARRRCRRRCSRCAELAHALPPPTVNPAPSVICRGRLLRGEKEETYSNEQKIHRTPNPIRNEHIRCVLLFILCFWMAVEQRSTEQYGENETKKNRSSHPIKQLEYPIRCGAEMANEFVK